MVTFFEVNGPGGNIKDPGLKKPNQGKGRIIMKIKRAPYLFLSIFFGFVLLLFAFNIVNYLLVRARSEKAAMLPSDAVHLEAPQRKMAAGKSWSDFPPFDSSKNLTRPSSELIPADADSLSPKGKLKK